MKEITKTTNIPAFFPQGFKRKKKKKEKWFMNEAKFALELMEEYGLEPKEVLEIILETDIEKAAAKMVANIKDPEDKAAAKKKFIAQMKKRMEKNNEL